MVDILMGGNTQMYYLNGGIDYNEIVTSLSSLLSPGPGEQITLMMMMVCIHLMVSKEAVVVVVVVV